MSQKQVYWYMLNFNSFRCDTNLTKAHHSFGHVEMGVKTAFAGPRIPDQLPPKPPVGGNGYATATIHFLPIQSSSVQLSSKRTECHLQASRSKSNDEDITSNALCATLSQLIDTPKPWDCTTRLISPHKSLKFILVPHVAAYPLAEDLEITLKDTVEVVENSSKYGTLFNGDPPEKVDIVLAANTESSQPPRYRKLAVILKPASARGKKSAEVLATRKVVEKPSKWKCPKESKQNGKAEAKIPVPHGAYGTRGA
ncbi:hypothetical protein B0H11DRAFT_1907552 [Mycena galericulata]|nr:hypothetical protein B0H11DRAFT_1907552 [Mycena galericulata]